MGFIELHPTFGMRHCLLVCDACDSVLGTDGTPQKKHAASDPTDLAPYYESPSVLRDRASRAQWVEQDGRWSCTNCQRLGNPTRV
jgi:hypothetical protein